MASHCGAWVRKSRCGCMPRRSTRRVSARGCRVSRHYGSGVAEAPPSPARICISLGVLVVLAAAVVAIWGVLRLRWLSQEIDDEPVVTLLRGLEVRDKRSRNLRSALLLFVAGFSLYCIAIAQLLWAAQPPG